MRFGRYFSGSLAVFEERGEGGQSLGFCRRPEPRRRNSVSLRGKLREGRKSLCPSVALAKEGPSQFKNRPPEFIGKMRRSLIKILCLGVFLW